MQPMPIISWKRATGLSCLAVHGPFLAMAIFTLLFVSCSHCKKSAWLLLPCGPGLISSEFCRQVFDFTRPADWLGFTMSLAITVGLVFLLASFIRKGGSLRTISVVMVLVLSSVAALCTLGMIRS